MVNIRRDIQRMLSSFREPNFKRFKILASDPETKTILIEEVVGFLNGWGEQAWVDEELIQFLGKDIFNITSTEFIEEMDENVKNRVVSEVVKEAYFYFAERNKIEKNQHSLPSQAELVKRMLEVDNADESWSPLNLSDILQQYVKYFKATGDFQPVGFALNRIFTAVQQNYQIRYAGFHELLDSTVREVFSIDATDERLWIKWATSFLKIGSSEVAEVVLWEAFRRRPDSSYIAFALLKTFERTKYHYQNRIRFARMAKSRFHFNRYLELEYCRLNGYSNIFDQIKHGISELVDLINRIEQVRYETVSLASIISQNWADIEKNDSVDWLLDCLVGGLSGKPKLVSSVAYRLNRYHGLSEPAQKILVAQISVEKSDESREILINSLAKLYASSKDIAGLTQAIKTLDGYNGQATLNHKAKLLFQRHNDGDWDLAEKLLRENLLKDQSDYYTISQLAILLLHFGKNREPEVVSLLSIHAPENVELSELLNQIQDGTFVRSDLDIEEDDSLDFPESSDFDPSGMSGVSSAPLTSSDVTPLPDDVSINSMLRKLKFEIDYGTNQSAAFARKKLGRVEVENSSDYFTFLTIEYSPEIHQNQEFLKNETAGHLAAQLVSAYAKEDRSRFHLIESDFPRLVSVIRFAEAALGDEDAYKSVQTLANADTTNFPWERSIVSNICSSRFGINLMFRMTSSDYILAANENRRRFSDLVGSVIMLESIAA
jgi:hypothetical protein